MSDHCKSEVWLMTSQTFGLSTGRFLLVVRSIQFNSIQCVLFILLLGIQLYMTIL
jgi:hypothetical protein